MTKRWTVARSLGVVSVCVVGATKVAPTGLVKIQPGARAEELDGDVLPRG